MSVASEPTLSFSTAAAQRVRDLMVEEGNYNLKLRVYITGGGCSGFQYGFAFDENVKPDDCVVEKEIRLTEEEQEEDDEEGKGGKGGKGATTVKVLIDALSIMYLAGAEIDYKESLQGAHFTVRNPNAQTTCSCGSSFSL